MARRLAAAFSLLVFTVCLAAGAVAGNAFASTVWHALVAMLGTLVVGLIVGVMAQKMLDENLNSANVTASEPNPAKKNVETKQAK